MSDGQQKLIKDIEEEPLVPVPKGKATDVATAGGDLIAMAINRDLDIDKLQALIAMKVAEEERQSKRTFDAKFAEMQAAFEPVRKAKQGDKAKYAPIEDLQKKYDPTIAAHGFSYTWNEEQLADGWIGITLLISGHGHTRTNSKAMPPYKPDTTQSGKSIMNAMQAEGVRSSYGRRYTFISGFGLTIEGEDTDGVSPEDLTDLENIIAKLEKNESKEAYMKEYARLWNANQGERWIQDALMKSKANRGY